MPYLLYIIETIVLTILLGFVGIPLAKNVQGPPVNPYRRSEISSCQGRYTDHGRTVHDSGGRSGYRM